MKKLILSVVFATVTASTAFAADMQIPWADNSGGTESTHIAAQNQDLNYQHQKVTKQWKALGLTTAEAFLKMNRPLLATNPPWLRTLL